MNIIVIILICLAYIFGGVGYVTTVKSNIDNLFKNGKKTVLVILFIFWLFWLITLGFAYTMTEIEFYIREKLGYKY